MKNVFILVTIFFLAQAKIIAQKISPQSPLAINIDMSRFKMSTDITYLEVYYAVYPKNVTLENVNDTLQGLVLLQTKILDLKKDSIVYCIFSKIPIRITDTLFYGSCYVGKLIYALPVGSYEVSINGSDYRNQARKDSVIRKISINKYNNSLVISDIDLCTKIEESDNNKNPFYKNSYVVMPNPSLLFGGKTAPVVFSYTELYNINPGLTYSIIVGLMDGNGNIIKQRNNIHRYSSHSIVDVNSLNIYSVPSGKYKFVLIVADTLGKEIARSEKAIYIYNPHLQSVASASISARNAEFIGLSDDELIDEFNKAKYIASVDDEKSFNNLKTAGARREFLSIFWKNVEGGLRGRNDITRSFYLDRVRIATQRYRAAGRKGWQTDRGRIYILFGEPDDVQRFPSTDNEKPYEIWLYNQIESGVKFVFVDRSGIGDYSLVHSTKRGEIQDENWEQNLR